MLNVHMNAHGASSAQGQHQEKSGPLAMLTKLSCQQSFREREQLALRATGGTRRPQGQVESAKIRQQVAMDSFRGSPLSCFYFTHANVLTVIDTGVL